MGFSEYFLVFIWICVKNPGNQLAGVDLASGYGVLEVTDEVNLELRIGTKWTFVKNSTPAIPVFVIWSENYQPVNCGNVLSDGICNFFKFKNNVWSGCWNFLTFIQSTFPYVAFQKSVKVSEHGNMSTNGNIDSRFNPAAGKSFITALHFLVEVSINIPKIGILLDSFGRASAIWAQNYQRTLT